MGQNIAGRIINRVATGDYVPLTTTRPRRYGKFWFAIPGGIATLFGMAWVSATFPESEFLAYALSIVLLVGIGVGVVSVLKAVLPKAIKGTVAVHRGGSHVARTTGRFAQDHGWPSWTDAWGKKGHRPGGSFRGVMRGYLRLWLVAMVLGVLTIPLDSGAFLLMTLIFGGFFALPAAVLLWHCRVCDFDQAKGWATTAFLWFAIDRLPWTNGGRVRAYPSMAEKLGTDQFERSSWDPASAYHHPPTGDSGSAG